MQLSNHILGIIFALTSAVLWGGGDFSGGLAARRHHAYQVLVLSALSGMVVLVAAALVSRESFPVVSGMLYALAAGACGAVGLAALYRALSLGQAASTAPTAAVVGAAFPVIYRAAVSGLPSPAQLAGFGIALLGIWLVSTPSTGRPGVSPTAFRLALLAGAGFGAFYILLGLVEDGKVFTPLILARLSTLAAGLIFLRSSRLPVPAPHRNLPALLAGLLDAGGNLFFILAKQFTRLDTAAVLASFYPATTVVLSAIILKEQVRRAQLVGVMLCLAAVALIST